LATPSTIKSGLYQNALRQVGVKIVIPNSKQLNSLEKVIRNVISGKDTDADCQILAKVALSLKAQGASGIILGCTELPLVFPRKFPMPVFDSIEILSRLLLRKFFEGGDKRE
jgi:aspartate racemase